MMLWVQKNTIYLILIGWFDSQATGDHLPKSPKIPDPIASSIEYNLKQADRQYLQEAYAAQGY